ncbi:O-antigen ligase family protein [Serratia fonticola]|uniref:O-antigen ligase family protein n=1 Tax=Serratia fonticola TaxID=47917 RepID=UPI0015768535|nr:O-antigen ligase family protein [Serratia fonticola]NTY86848.1 O-antigen ligase family protein [Serratia fonticola]NTZ12817.1 O-antigen ligase family protein [Serratia fonticola]
MNAVTIRYSSFIMFICAVGSQLTDVSIGPLKVWEFLAITILAFSIRTINKKYSGFIIFFTLLLFFSFVASYFSDVKYYGYGGLKEKYIISVVRFIELMLCILTAMTVSNAALRYNADPVNLISKFLKYNFYLTVVVLVLFCIDLILNTKIVSYGLKGRLSGFYVEGGPYGLFMSTLIFLELITSKRKLYLIVFCIALFLAQSKAAMISLLIFIMINIMIKNRFLASFVMPRNFFRFSFFLIISIVITSFTAYNVAHNYIEDIQNSNYLLDSRSNDKSFVMGRIAAYHIGPNIIMDKPILGVGLGAYSLVRNNPKYSQDFPQVSDWDLTGLGGLFNLLVENGLFGLLGFVFVTFRFYKLDALGTGFLMLFIVPFALGAQLYMIYPWIYLGLYTSLVSYKTKQLNIS